MAAPPAESPISIPSESPTPERPRFRLRSSSSSLSAVPAPRDTRAGSSVPAPSQRRARLSSDITDIPARTYQRPAAAAAAARPTSALQPNARPFVPRPNAGLALPAQPRSGSGASTPNSTRAGPSREGIIDLTGDDDDDDEAARPAVAVAGPARRRVDPANRPLLRDLRQLDEIVAQRGAATRAILEPEIDLRRRRAVLSPPAYPQPGHARRVFPEDPYGARIRAAGQYPLRGYRGGPMIDPDPRAQDDEEDDLDYRPDLDGLEAEPYAQARPPVRRPIGLGGAVLRAGDRQINYRNNNANINANNAQNVFPAPRDARAAIFERQRLDDQLNRGIHRRIAERDNGGFMGLFDGWQADAYLQRFLGPALARWGGGPGGGGGGGPGPAGMANQQRAQDDPQAIVAQVPKPHFPPEPEGYTSNFGLDDGPIEIDQPTPIKPKPKPFLACVHCVEPLLQSSAYRTPADRVWALQCGHLIDQKCLDARSVPAAGDPAGLPVLDAEEEAPPAKRSRTKRGRAAATSAARRKIAAQPVEYEWTCPAKHCGHPHRSVLKDGEWKQDELEGAFQLYA